MRPGHLDRFLEELDAWARSRRAPVATISYGDQADQVIDLYGPDRRDLLVLLLHGGFWRPEYDRSTMRALATAFAEAGWAAANVEYRRLGPGAWRPLLDDVRRARERLSGFARTIAVGHSAGGHLALWLAAEGLVDGVVTLGGVCDLEDAQVERLGNDAVFELLGGAPAEAADAYRAADPAPRLPLRRPQVLVHGTSDDRVPIGHAARYAERAAAAGDDCRLVEVDAEHFLPLDPRSHVWPTIVEAVGELAGDRLGVGTP